MITTKTTSNAISRSTMKQEALAKDAIVGVLTS
jgi:hypothetical protein